MLRLLPLRPGVWRLLLQVCLLGFVLTSSHARAEIRLEDDGGQLVTLSRPAERIVSLAPNLTELMFDLGVGARVVGTSAYSNYPDPARQIPRVGGHDRFDFERIVALHPDLVLVWKSGNGMDTARRLRELGLPTFVVALRSLPDVGRALRHLGALTGRVGRAERLATAYRKHLAELTARFEHREPVSVFFQVWPRPLMTVGGPQFLTDILRRCGARNIFADQSAVAFSVSLEAVIARQPQAIVAVAGENEDPLARWRDLPGIPAVQAHHLIVVHTDSLSRPTPAILDGMTQLCLALDSVRKQEAAEFPPKAGN